MRTSVLEWNQKISVSIRVREGHILTSVIYSSPNGQICPNLNKDGLANTSKKSHNHLQLVPIITHSLIFGTFIRITRLLSECTSSRSIKYQWVSECALYVRIITGYHIASGLSYERHGNHLWKELQSLRRAQTADEISQISDHQR